MNTTIGTGGKEGCACIDTSATLSSLADRSCITPDGGDGVLLDFTGPCVNITFGASVCHPHELNVDYNCIEEENVQKNSNESIPEYCYRSWCYVDAMECMKTEERIYRSQLFPAGVGADVVSLQFAYRHIMICSHRI